MAGSPAGGSPRRGKGETRRGKIVPRGPGVSKTSLSSTRRTLPTRRGGAPFFAGFRLLDHPADIGVEARGNSLAEAFRYAALGMMSIILDVTSVQPREIRMVNVEAADMEQLLVRWLSEVLYLYDGQGFAVHDVRVLSLEPQRLAAEVRGEAFSMDRHSTRLDVKAVTYHQLTVESSRAVTRVRVFFDI